MTKSFFVLVAVLVPVIAFAGNGKKRMPASEPAPIPTPTYEWNQVLPVKQEALHLAGGATEGEALYQTCVQCHGRAGEGTVDGKYPALAGQYHTVIIKQIEEIKAGFRDNPEMTPHLAVVKSGQDVADIAAFIARLPVSANNQKGPENPQAISRGAGIYLRSCAVCHAVDGKGDLGHFYPRVAGQHYDYLVRQMVASRDGKRRNAKPEMVESLKGLTDEDISAVANYMSRMAGLLPKK